MEATALLSALVGARRRAGEMPAAHAAEEIMKIVTYTGESTRHPASEEDSESGLVSRPLSSDGADRVREKYIT